ncbi:pseudouridylate synthase RPUSD4, mitochondrial-like [Phaenicophaeus curvirostris]|uniref:pseudouridylate synthase RPUSD4, mitochondrial-like n=1 Tax=Phaenicophaeus curvirostris TaxID=33595 RepID=UPI0037F0CEDD
MAAGLWRLWRRSALPRAGCGLGGIGRAEAGAERLAERLRAERSGKRSEEIPKDPAQRRVRELAMLSKRLQQVHPNVLAKVLKQGTVYQNEEIVVINKPYGLPVHGNARRVDRTPRPREAWA